MAEPVIATALQYARYGGPEVLEVAERAVPAPGEGQVRLLVRAAAANPFDGKARSGRFAGGADAPDEPKPVGFDVAGEVEAVGPGVTDVAVGDAVLGLGTGAMATVALAGPVVAKPETLSWAEAAAWPVVTEAALRGLDEVGGAQEGETLLVHGGMGSVGRLVVQLGVRAGARVIATAGERDHDALRALGAIPATYGDGWADRVRDASPAAGGEDGRVAVDAVVDAAGAGVLVDSVALAGGTDRVMTLAGDDADDAGIAFSGSGTPEQQARSIAAIPALVADGVTVPVAEAFPFERAVEAYEALERGPRGKLVVTIEASPTPPRSTSGASAP